MSFRYWPLFLNIEMQSDRSLLKSNPESFSELNSSRPFFIVLNSREFFGKKKILISFTKLKMWRGEREREYQSQGKRGS